MPERKLIYADTVVEKLAELILLGDHEKQVINLFVDQCMAVDAVEVKTLEAWLYQIALNNVGTDFGEACEEIIDRLEGLRVFARERKTQ